MRLFYFGSARPVVPSWRVSAECQPVRRTSVVGAADRLCYIGSSSKISTANFPSMPDRNGRPSVNAFAAARSSASTIV
jgi:hypothetical protein